MRIITGKGRAIDVPDDIFQYILAWCIGGPDGSGNATENVLQLRLVSREMKALVSTMARSAWNKPIRNLGLFMVSTVDRYAGLGVKGGRRALHESWDVYVLVAYGKQMQAYLAVESTQKKMSTFLSDSWAIKQFGPATSSRPKADAWILGHIHRCNTMRLMVDPSDWSKLWSDDRDEPTRLGRRLLELEKAGYRPQDPTTDGGSRAPWAGFGLLLVPRSQPSDPRYLAQLAAYDKTDLTQAKILLEYFVRKILEDGSLSPHFMLPGVADTTRLQTFLQLEAPHSRMVPGYWPRGGWSHGLERPLGGGGGGELFTIVDNPCTPDSQVDIVYSSRWGMTSLPEPSALKSDDNGADVEDLVWTCELPQTSAPCQRVLAYLHSAVKNCPYETVKIEGARLAHGGSMNVGAIWDWAFGDVPIFQFMDNRYEITQVRVIYSPKRWDAYLKYKSEHVAADLSKINWAGDPQETEGFKFPLSFEQGECFLVHGTAFKTMKYIARGGFGPQYCKHRKIGGYGSIGQGSYLTDNLAKISTYANCPGCDTSGAPCDCVDDDGLPLERVAIISRVFIPKGVKLTTHKKLQYKSDPLTKKPDRAMVIGMAGESSKWPNNVFLLRHADMAYPEMLVYFRWYKGDIH